MIFALILSSFLAVIGQANEIRRVNVARKEEKYE